LVFDVAAFRTQGDFHGVGQNIDAGAHAIARVDAEADFLAGHELSF